VKNWVFSFFNIFNKEVRKMAFEIGLTCIVISVAVTGLRALAAYNRFRDKDWE
jgi:hypothetical protein